MPTWGQHPSRAAQPSWLEAEPTPAPPSLPGPQCSMRPSAPRPPHPRSMLLAQAKEMDERARQGGEAVFSLPCELLRAPEECARRVQVQAPAPPAACPRLACSCARRAPSFFAGQPSGGLFWGARWPAAPPLPGHSPLCLPATQERLTSWPLLPREARILLARRYQHTRVGGELEAEGVRVLHAGGGRDPTAGARTASRQEKQRVRGSPSSQGGSPLPWTCHRRLLGSWSTTAADPCCQGPGLLLGAPHSAWCAVMVPQVGAAEAKAEQLSKAAEKVAAERQKKAEAVATAAEAAAQRQTARAELLGQQLAKRVAAAGDSRVGADAGMGELLPWSRVDGLGLWPNLARFGACGRVPARAGTHGRPVSCLLRADAASHTPGRACPNTPRPDV